MTKVIFRKDKNTGDVIAFFPQFSANYGNIVCYQHIGQHGEASFEYYKDTVKVGEQEYNDLFTELQNYGYDDLSVVSRLNYNELQNNWQ